jgi:hypothetical protein
MGCPKRYGPATKHSSMQISQWELVAHQVAKIRAWPPEPCSYGMSPTTTVVP